jgi:type IV secretion system T-DNA border endonuclease VirD2
MARSDAVAAVSGELFEEGWSRVRGSMQGLHQKRQQMARAARGHRAAVFKAIRGGGTSTKGQLANQLTYLTTKSSHIIDSRGEFDGKKTLTADEIKSVTERFAKRWDEKFNPKLGNTTHMLMSFPIGTKGEDVRDIAGRVAERFFENDERNFDYIIAVHEDRDHPHAHIVLNRRSHEGELFYLGRDHHFNYDDFRLAMVEEAEKLGVKLEATRRVHRGVVDYAPRTPEVYAAKAEDRAAIGRERIGRDLDRALAEVAANAQVYRSLAAEASAENREDIENAFLKASAILARQGRLEPEGEVYMATTESFDDLNGRFTQQVQRVSRMIEDAPEGQKAAIQRQLTDALAPIAHMQPLGTRSSTLSQAPSATGIYSERNINAGMVDELRSDKTRAQVETALRGTGISSEAVVARIEQGANNAALERQWYADDLQSIARTYELNLERQEDLRVGVDLLDKVHVELGVTLERAEVLRRDGVEQTADTTFHYERESVEDMSRAVRQDMRDRGWTEDQIAERADEIEVRAEARLEAEQRAYLERHPELLARPDAVLDRTDPFNDRIVDQERAEQIDREIENIVERSDGRTEIDVAVAADFKERYPDMPDHLAKGLAATYIASFSANNRDALLEAEREAAREVDGREALSERLATDAGIERAEAEGVAGVDREAAIDREVQAEIARLRAEGYSRAYISERSFEIEADATARVDAERDAFSDDAPRDVDLTGGMAAVEARDMRMTVIAYDRPEVARVIEHEREHRLEDPFANDEQRQVFRDEIERDLDDDQIARLKDGDADVLDEVIDDRLERLYAAKAYLQSDAETAYSEATEEVVSEIVDEEYEAQRLKSVASHTEKGQTHG